MIKFYISYFYKIRHMTSNMVPISTAMYDPKWFHKNKGNNYRYLDKNNVVNGVRMENLMMPTSRYQKLINSHTDCENCKCSEEEIWSFGYCPFMKEYYTCLNEQNPNFDKFIERCEGYLHFLNVSFGFNVDTIVFIVHEPSYRKCGERPVLQNWFIEHGMMLPEWEPEICEKVQ